MQHFCRHSEIHVISQRRLEKLPLGVPKHEMSCDQSENCQHSGRLPDGNCSCGCQRLMHLQTLPERMDLNAQGVQPCDPV